MTKSAQSNDDSPEKFQIQVAKFEAREPKSPEDTSKILESSLKLSHSDEPECLENPKSILKEYVVELKKILKKENLSNSNKKVSDPEFGEIENITPSKKCSVQTNRKIAEERKTEKKKFVKINKKQRQVQSRILEKVLANDNFHDSVFYPSPQSSTREKVSLREISLSQSRDEFFD